VGAFNAITDVSLETMLHELVEWGSLIENSNELILFQMESFDGGSNAFDESIKLLNTIGIKTMC